MKVLVGDVGGTHARLAVVEISQQRIHIAQASTYSSRQFPGLAPIVLDFLSRIGEQLDHACFGVACPVVNGDCETTNLPWTVSARHLAAEIQIPDTRVINDLDAIACGIARLDPDDLVTLQHGTPAPHGVIGLIGAGTGLGQAFLVWDGTRYRTCPSEGGHTSFAAQNELEWDLYRFLSPALEHVSFERVLSGPGLVNVYNFLVNRDKELERPATRKAITEQGARAISLHALAGTDPLCIKALDLFVTVYGAQAGNLALTVLATGGVYLVGGIAPAIVRKLKDGAFLTAFREKGRLGTLLTDIPIHVVMNPHIGLFGAAVAATEDVELPNSSDVAEVSSDMTLEAS